MGLKQATSASRAGTILFVDDEPLSLKYFKASVGKYANVVTADTPEAAMKILQSEGDTISVVVSDERMPRDSGVAFLSDVRKSWPSTVRILTSAYANIDLEQAINGAAIHRFVPKPWDLDELCSAMKEALHADADEAGAVVSPQRIDAQTASLELLAVLTRELVQPLQSIETEAMKISAASGTQPTLQISRSASAAASWLTNYRVGMHAASAEQIRRHVEHCKSLAGPMMALTDSLLKTGSSKSYSMAETISDAVAKIGRSSRALFNIDARKDFTYRLPREAIEFVLTNLLQDAASKAAGTRSAISIALVRGFDYNEVTIAAPTVDQADKSEVERINRSTLWAFGGELLFSSDGAKGTEIARIRLPVPTPMAVSGSPLSSH